MASPIPTPAASPTVVIVPSPTPAPAGSTGGVASLSGGLLAVEIAFGLLLLVAILTPLILALQPAFIKRDYSTWFLLHWGVAAVALLVLGMLALAQALPDALIAIFASVFGVIFGTSASRPPGSGTSSSQTAATGLAVFPATGKAGDPISISGQGFTSKSMARLGAEAVANVKVSEDGTRLVGTAPAGSGKVDVLVYDPGSSQGQTLVDGFTYE